MNYMDADLRRYLQQNRNQITWKTKIQIIFEIVKALCRVHEENSVHKNLHSGNVLHLKDKNDWYISDIGIYGPANEPFLPYIAPKQQKKEAINLILNLLLGFGPISLQN